MLQVTSPEICNQILDMYQSGIDIQLMVSSHISDEKDCLKANICYEYLYQQQQQQKEQQKEEGKGEEEGLGGGGGITNIRLNSKNYTQAHSKYWILDETTVYVSTGNWSPEDIPYKYSSNIYPIYNEPNWTIVNRDYTIATQSNFVLTDIMNAFKGDWIASGTSYWSPNNLVTCG
mmetsp:Transcript_28033/g.36217  ORF Transcript_28033/g.36217 Transcript_28033/m.36217 type:complete len:175 (-) Transcript_28033:66-590(-)